MFKFLKNQRIKVQKVGIEEGERRRDGRGGRPGHYISLAFVKRNKQPLMITDSD